MALFTNAYFILKINKNYTIIVSPVIDSPVEMGLKNEPLAPGSYNERLFLIFWCHYAIF